MDILKDKTKIIISMLWIYFIILLIIDIEFIYQSLYWPEELCIDATLIKYFSWEFLNGREVYENFFTTNLPVTLYIFSSAIKILGLSSMAARIHDIFWIVMLMIATCYYFKESSILIRVIVTSLIGTIPAMVTPTGSLERELILLPFWMFFLTIWQESERQEITKSKWFLACLLLAFSFFIKPVGLFLISFAFIATWITTTKDKNRFRKIYINYLFITGLAFLFAFFLVMLPFIIQGKFSQPILAWYQYFIDMASSVDVGSRPAMLIDIFVWNPHDWAIPFNKPDSNTMQIARFGIGSFIILIYYIYLLYHRQIKTGGVVLLFAALASYILQARGYGYQLLPFWYGMIIIFVLVLEFLLKKIDNNRKSIIYYLIILFLLIYQYKYNKTAYKMYKNTLIYSEFLEKPNKDFPIKTSKVLQELIKKLPERQLTMEVFDVFSVPYIAVMKNNIQTITGIPELYVYHSKNREKYKKIALTKLKNSPPTLVVLNSSFKHREKNIYQVFPELQQFLRKNYQLYKKTYEFTGLKYDIHVKKAIPKI